jgi:hypothetical protein
VRNQFDVDGKLVKPLGDNPQGYLVYTPDDHVIVWMAALASQGANARSQVCSRAA